MPTSNWVKCGFKRLAARSYANLRTALVAVFLSFSCPLAKLCYVLLIVMTKRAARVSEKKQVLHDVDTALVK